LIRWVIFDSPTQLNVRLYVGQGTVGLWDPSQADESAIRTDVSVENDNRLTTDNLSQGYLAVADPYSGDLIATVLLRNGSVATLQRADRPRFSLSENPYVIQLDKVSGRLEVWARNGDERDIRIQIKSALGTAYIEHGGYFWIDSRMDLFKVTARSGSVTLIGPDRRAQHIAEGGEGTIRQGDPTIIVSSGPIDLLPNWDFGQEANVPNPGTGDPEDWPVEWACGWTPSDDPAFQDAPPGTWGLTRVNGRRVLHIERLQHPDPGPGATGCLKYPGGSAGLDVNQYDTLRLRVTMQVKYQSLSACGVAGTECPVMLYINYQDKFGNNNRVWIHGFYTDYRPEEGGRTICDSCLQPHEQINQGAWYTYDADLFTNLPGDQRPATINYIRFYADGHQYDVLLNEVALIATLPQASEPAAATP
jgi:hypothetical protein